MSFNSLIAPGQACVLAPQSPGTLSGSISAGVPLVLTFDISTASRLTMVLLNTHGSASIDSVKIEISATGALYGEDVQVGEDIGELTFGQHFLLQYSDLAADVMRVTLNAASACSYQIDIKGVR